MPTQSITNNNGINSMTPVEPVNQSTAPVTAKEFKTKINEYLAEGIKNNLSQDYVARQIESLAKENPDLASKAGLTDYQSIKNGVDQAYQAGAGNRPLALGSASDVDLFQLGVRIDADRRIQPKPMTAGDKAVTKSVGHEVMIGATIATGAAGAPIALSVAKAAWQALMGAAASASASPWAKWMLLARESAIVAGALRVTRWLQGATGVESLEINIAGTGTPSDLYSHTAAVPGGELCGEGELCEEGGRTSTSVARRRSSSPARAISAACTRRL